ncbi:MAG: hypothetical protein ABJK11_17620 [Balneola sp.]
MKKLIFIISAILFTLIPPSANSQNSGDRYMACSYIDCSYIGNAVCGIGQLWQPDGSIDFYWCVITVVVGERPPTPIDI